MALPSDGDRIPVTRHDADGTIVDGTAMIVTKQDDDGFTWYVGAGDFRDLDFEPMTLPVGSEFRISLEV